MLRCFNLKEKTFRAIYTYGNKNIVHAEISVFFGCFRKITVFIYASGKGLKFEEF